MTVVSGKLIIIQLVKKFTFCGTSHSQEPATEPYPEPHASNPHFSILFP